MNKVLVVVAMAKAKYSSLRRTTANKCVTHNGDDNVCVRADIKHFCNKRSGSFAARKRFQPLIENMKRPPQEI